MCLWTPPDGGSQILPGSVPYSWGTAVRPLLKPALRRLWRDPTTLQLGIDPRYALVLTGVALPHSRVLDLLDGTHELAELGADAERLGCPPEGIHTLLKALTDAGALDDAAAAGGTLDRRRQPDLLSLSLLHREPGAAARVMAARATAAVEVLGAGRVGATIATLLAAAGVGHLALTDSGPLRQADYAPGGVRGSTARHGSRAEAARAVLPGRTVSRGSAAQTGSTVVLAPTGSVIPPEWLGRVRHRPHLPVIIRETTAVIGPLVLPGRSPCLRCVELIRGDRDPVWPVLAAQLIGETQGVEPCDIALATAAASLAAMHVLAWLDNGEAGPPPSVGGVLELSLVDLRLRRRTVAAHPGCGCGAIDLDSGAA